MIFKQIYLIYKWDPNRDYHSCWSGLVCFYGVSTIVGCSMPNPVFTYILNI